MAVDLYKMKNKPLENIEYANKIVMRLVTDSFLPRMDTYIDYVMSTFGNKHYKKFIHDLSKDLIVVVAELDDSKPDYLKKAKQIIAQVWERYPYPKAVFEAEAWGCRIVRADPDSPANEAAALSLLIYPEDELRPIVQNLRVSLNEAGILKGHSPQQKLGPLQFTSQFMSLARHNAVCNCGSMQKFDVSKMIKALNAVFGMSNVGKCQLKDMILIDTNGIGSTSLGLFHAKQYDRFRNISPKTPFTNPPSRWNVFKIVLPINDQEYIQKLNCYIDCLNYKSGEYYSDYLCPREKIYICIGKVRLPYYDESLFPLAKACLQRILNEQFKKFDYHHDNMHFHVDSFGFLAHRIPDTQRVTKIYVDFRNVELRNFAVSLQASLKESIIERVFESENERSDYPMHFSVMSVRARNRVHEDQIYDFNAQKILVDYLPKGQYFGRVFVNDVMVLEDDTDELIYSYKIFKQFFSVF